ncbi:MAG TPA: hypothetical protein PLN13_03215 [Bacteroidia bacterium]|nr:hypothetical protein [Bacteroidia bacterium]HRH07563.1 hypothetical protein [Bacteroidia bacterium]
MFIFSAISKLFPLEIFEYSLVYQGIANWTMAPLLARSLICLELFLGIALLFNQLLKQIILPSAFILLLIFNAYLGYVWFTQGNSGNCGCFGTILPLTPAESLLKNFFLMLLTVFLYITSSVKPWKYKVFLPLLFLVILTTLIVLYPILDYSYIPKKLTNEIAEVTVLKGFSDHTESPLAEGKKLVGVFNMACSHCVEVAIKLSATKARIKLPQDYYILLGDSSEVADFYSITHSSAPYKLMPSAEFLKQFHSGWPRVYLLNKGYIRYDNNYHSFNGQDFEKEVRKFMLEN